eukprot:gene9170-16302_t
MEILNEQRLFSSFFIQLCLDNLEIYSSATSSLHSKSSLRLTLLLFRRTPTAASTTRKKEKNEKEKVSTMMETRSQLRARNVIAKARIASRARIARAKRISDVEKVRARDLDARAEFMANKLDECTWGRTSQ